MPRSQARKDEDICKELDQGESTAPSVARGLRSNAARYRPCAILHHMVLYVESTKHQSRNCGHDKQSEWTMTCAYVCDVLSPKCKDMPLGILCF